MINMNDVDIYIILQKDGEMRIKVGSKVPYALPVEMNEIKFIASIPSGGFLIIMEDPKIRLKH